MLDHEPDTHDTTSSTTPPATEQPAAPRRRRRAATRKAGPPSVSPAEAETPAVVVESSPAADPATAPATQTETKAKPGSDEPQASARQGSAPEAGVPQGDSTEAAVAEQPVAKKTARKRAAKAPAEGTTTRSPRKRAVKRTAAAKDGQAKAEPAIAEPALSEPVEVAGQSAAAQPSQDAVATLDEIKLALLADAAPSAPPADVTPPAEAVEEETEEAAAAEETAPSEDVAAVGSADSAELSEAEAEAEPTEPAPAESEIEADATQADAAQPETGVPAVEGVNPDGVVDAELTQSSGADAGSDAADESGHEDSAGQVAETPATDATAENAAGPAGEKDADSSAAAEDSDEAVGESDEEDDDTPRRRRRRRGGRRRRRGGADNDNDNRRDDAEQDGEAPAAGTDAASSPAATAPSAAAKATDTEAEKSGGDTAEAESGADEGNEDGGQRRRRRRRRRRGEDNAPAADDPVDVVVRVREPRSRKQAAQEVSGIEGSTRMEAKRQRRREGREAGRRRVPILSEAEFLARRESVVRKMIIRQREELSQIAVLEDDILVEHYVDRESAASLIGNVYLGRVQNVLPSMEAAFIDIGRGRNAVLYAGEVDWESYGANGQQRKVENVLKSGQTVLVQVTKDPVGAKGARLTNHVTLPGRYIVYAPGGHLSGISRKLPDTERKRLKSILNELVPDEASVIVRTAAEGASEDELVRDVNRLKAQWEDIERKVKAGGAPKLLYGEPDLTVRIVRDLFTEDFAELIIQGNGSMTDAYDAVDAYVGHVAPHLHDRMRRWDAASEGDLFASYRLDEQIAKALERKVFLPSGGSLIIDRTEAMTVIDVNTGKFTGSGGNLEATVTSNNLEAAEEIVRQLRLRDIGGIIVIDFIDMVLPSNRELLLRRLVECLGRDRTRHQVAEVTSLGLVQMTRKKIGTGLLEAFSIECEHCHGRGYETSEVPVETQKQPDGGSRDQRGRGRGRGNSSNSNPNGSARPPFPMPAPPLNRPEPLPVVPAAESADAVPDTPATVSAGTEAVLDR